MNEDNETNSMNEDQNEYFEDTAFDPMPKRHIPVWVILFLIGIIALDIICMIQFPKVLSDYKIYKTAESRISSGETSQTLTDLSDLAGKHSESTPIIMKGIKLSIQNGYYDMAGNLYDTYLVGLSLSDDEYNQAVHFSTRLNEYYDTYDAIEKIFSTVSDADSSGEINYDEQKAQLTALLNEKGMDIAYIYYYLGLIETDMKIAAEDLQNCYNVDPEMFDVRTQLGVMYRRTGDYAKAKQYCEEALAKEKTDAGALRAMAIIDMLEGNLESGRSYAEAAYKSYPDGYYVRETYMIALAMNDKKEEAKTIQEEMKNANEAIDDDTLKLINGELTLVDYYVD